MYSRTSIINHSNIFVTIVKELIEAAQPSAQVDTVRVLSRMQRQDLAAFLLARAFGYRSRNQAQLLGYTFDDMYTPAGGRGCLGGVEDHRASAAQALVRRLLPANP